MKDSHEESGPQRHNARDHEDTPKSAAAVTNGEAVLYLVLFIIFYIAGVGALIFYEVAYGSAPRSISSMPSSPTCGAP